MKGVFKVYEHQDTGLMRLDPRPKIIAAAALSLVCLQSGVLFLVLASLAAAAVAAGARLAPRRLFSAVRPALPFIVVIFVLHAFSVQGDLPRYFGVGPVRMTREGLFEGIILAWRFSLLVLAGFLLLATTPAASLTSGMERLLRPVRALGISSHDLALMVTLALRLIPTLKDEVESLRHAEMARGADFAAGGILARGRAFSGLALPLSLALFRRCDRLVAAMHARAYDGGPRTDLHELSLFARDRVIIVLSVLAGLASFFV